MTKIDIIFYLWAIGGFLFLFCSVAFSRDDEVCRAKYIPALLAIVLWPLSISAVILYIFVKKIKNHN